MTEVREKWIREQARFRGIFDAERYKKGRFERKVPLGSFIRHADSKRFADQVFEAGSDGTQIQLFEEELAKYMGFKHAVALSSGEAALRMALKLAAERLYGSSTGISTPNGLGNGGSLLGKKVFCSDLTTADMAAPIVFEGGEPVFIDSSDRNWSMDPEVLELAFEKYPDVKIVVMNHVYGYPGEIMAIRKLCFEHEALLIECAGEALGASYRIGFNRKTACGSAEGLDSDPGEASASVSEEALDPDLRETSASSDARDEIWVRAGALGDYTVLDFGEDKLMGPSGGALLTREFYDSEKARYWASGARAATPWNQHEELGHACWMSELDAAMLRGQLRHLDEAVERKKTIYERYHEKLNGTLAYIIPIEDGTRPNFWISAMTCESSIQFMETRNDRCYTYQDVHGTAAPMEIYEALEAFHAGSRPVYKPMSMQPVFRNNEHFTLDGAWRMYESFANDTFWLRCDRARQYYESGICLPSDVSMTEEEQDRIIDILYACYDMADLNREARA